MQARHCGLPENTPLVELVAVGEEAGHAASALQIAADKYRGTSRARRVDTYPLPKKRDEYLDFSVMPCALPPPAARRSASMPVQRAPVGALQTAVVIPVVLLRCTGDCQLAGLCVCSVDII